MSMYRAWFFVSVVNPLAVKDYQEGISVRKVKTDKADALKIAQFAIDKGEILPQYSLMDTIRYDLKTIHRQYQLSSKTKTALNNNLIALLEQSYPGEDKYFDSPVRPDGTQKWVDFVDTFWHVECVSSLSQKAFVERYRNWCKRHGYKFSEQKAIELHTDARQKFPLGAQVRYLQAAGEGSCFPVECRFPYLGNLPRRNETSGFPASRIRNRHGNVRRRGFHGASADGGNRGCAPFCAPEVAGWLCGNRPDQGRFRRQDLQQ